MSRNQSDLAKWLARTSSTAASFVFALIYQTWDVMSLCLERRAFAYLCPKLLSNDSRHSFLCRPNPPALPCFVFHWPETHCSFRPFPHFFFSNTQTLAFVKLLSQPLRQIYTRPVFVISVSLSFFRCVLSTHSSSHLFESAQLLALVFSVSAFVNDHEFCEKWPEKVAKHFFSFLKFLCLESKSWIRFWMCLDEQSTTISKKWIAF